MIYTHDVKQLKNIDDNNLDIPATFAIIKRSYIRYIDNKITDINISSGEAPFLLVLNENDKITQKELSDSLRTSEGLTTRVLKNLEKKEYITREIDQNNKRRKIITITSNGKKTAQILKKYQKEWESQIFGSITDEELKSFKSILKNSLIKTIEVENGQYQQYP